MNYEKSLQYETTRLELALALIMADVGLVIRSKASRRPLQDDEDDQLAMISDGLEAISIEFDKVHALMKEGQ